MGLNTNARTNSSFVDSSVPTKRRLTASSAAARYLGRIAVTQILNSQIRYPGGLADRAPGLLDLDHMTRGAGAGEDVLG